MSETIQTAPPKHPSEVPPDTWLSFEDFNFLVPHMTKRQWHEGSKAGRLPKGLRMSRKSPLVFRAADLCEFFAARAAEVSQ